MTDFSEQVLIPLKFIRKLLKQFIRNEAGNYIMQKDSIRDQTGDNSSFSHPFLPHIITNMEVLPNKAPLFNFHVHELKIRLRLSSCLSVFFSEFPIH